MPKLCESEIEIMAIEELTELGYCYISGAEIAPETPLAERKSFSDVLLINRLTAALQKINPSVPNPCIEQAAKALQRINSGNLLADNELFHKYLIEGIPVEYRKGNDIVGDHVMLCDFETSSNNEFLVVNQYTIIQNGNNKRPDVLLFINGIPMVVIELKNPTDENATIRKAYDQIGTYKRAISDLFMYNEICIVSDGLEAKGGITYCTFFTFFCMENKRWCYGSR